MLRDRRVLVYLSFLIFTAIAFVPTIHNASGQLVGLVCLSPSPTASCPAPPVTISSPVGTLMDVSVIVQGSDILNGFGITLIANHTIIKPVDASLNGSLLNGGFITEKCVGGTLKVGAICGTTDNADTLDFAVQGPFGFTTFAPTSGLLFTAVYNVTGTATTPISFQTGCIQSSVNGTTTCISISNGSTSPTPETVQGASYTAAPTPTFTIGTSITDTEISIGKGETGNSTILLTSVNGFSGTVSLSMSTIPSAQHPPTVTLSSNSVTLTNGGFNSVLLTASAKNNTTRIVYTITVTGTSGSQIGSVQIQLTVSNG